MTKAEQWIKDHNDTTTQLDTLKKSRPRLELRWRQFPIRNLWAYLVFGLDNEGNISITAGQDLLFTISPAEALEIADFFQSLYQESVSPVGTECPDCGERLDQCKC